MSNTSHCTHCAGATGTVNAGRAAAPAIYTPPLSRKIMRKTPPRTAPRWAPHPPRPAELGGSGSQAQTPRHPPPRHRSQSTRRTPHTDGASVFTPEGGKARGARKARQGQRVGAPRGAPPHARTATQSQEQVPFLLGRVLDAPIEGQVGAGRTGDVVRPSQGLGQGVCHYLRYPLYTSSLDNHTHVHLEFS